MSNDLRDALLSGTLSLCSEGDVRVLRIEWCGDDRHDQADAAFDALEALAAPPQPAQVQHILDEAPSGSEVGSQSDGLLPCPFCGSNDLDFSSSNSIDCNVCGGSMYHGARLDDPDEEERVTTAWNTRAPAPSEPVRSDDRELIADLRKAGRYSIYDVLMARAADALEGRGEGWTEPNDGTVYTATQLADLLHGRDAFIVAHGLWGEFVDSLPPPPVQGGE